MKRALQVVSGRSDEKKIFRSKKLRRISKNPKIFFFAQNVFFDVKRTFQVLSSSSDHFWLPNSTKFHELQKFTSPPMIYTYPPLFTTLLSTRNTRILYNSPIDRCFKTVVLVVEREIMMVIKWKQRIVSLYRILINNCRIYCVQCVRCGSSRERRQVKGEGVVIV